METSAEIKPTNAAKSAEINGVDRTSDAYKLGACEGENKRLRRLIRDAERELENVLVSVYKMAPNKITNPVLRALRAAREE